MTETVLHFLSWVLVPMGLLPVITAIVLLPQVNSRRSVALKERARIQILLGLLGGLVAVLAANHVLGWNLELDWLLVGFVLVLLAIDVASGIWLWLYVTERFR